ncbi:MAG: TonB-dependent receptor [Termitinemataceae bacterium]|nr:MAG: TonB-dependent receptor [Termitinemataceae bacterium]
MPAIFRLAPVSFSAKQSGKYSAFSRGIHLKIESLRFVLILILFLLSSALVFCRDIEIKIIDAEIDIPLEGARLRLSSGNVYTCNSEGIAHINIADGKTEVIEILYPGYNSKNITIKNEDKKYYVFTLLLTGNTLQNEELIVKGTRREESAVDTGRSISLDRDNTEMTSEIGFIEDIMNSIKLLPGVGYTGSFNAQPSIRGGSPGDMIAVMDGFYIDFPYHWGGSYSIFDPKMVESARLYHGVFSAKYGHTVSGLLDVHTKKPSAEESSFEMSFSTSATSLSLSTPLYFGGEEIARGGIMFLGKVTYWDPFVWAAKGLSNFVKELEPVEIINVPPYIRCFGLSANYVWNANLESTLSTYVGTDGVGVFYDNENSQLNFSWDNVIAYISSGTTYYLNNVMSFKTTVGAGFHDAKMVAHLNFEGGDRPQKTDEYYTDDVLNLQIREDFDLDLKNGFFLSAGLEEVYRSWQQKTESSQTIAATDPDGYTTNIHFYYPIIDNYGFFTSLWGILQYRDPKEKFFVEAGLRVDMFSFYVGQQYVDCLPAINPRLNFDYYLLHDFGMINSLTLTLGSGLFSSTNENTTYADKEFGLSDNKIKQTRSLTNIAGINIKFADIYSFNLEFYYKYIFDRAYSKRIPDDVLGENNAVTKYYYDGMGSIFGFDIMLHKIKGRFLSGWISYSFNYAKYKDPNSSYAFRFARFKDDSDHWYFPDFHRFSYLNVVLNWMITQRFSIYTRLGFASGTPDLDYGTAEKYTDMDGNDRYKRSNSYSNTARTDPSLPLDIKFSWSVFKPNGKAQTEFYVAIENALSLIYTPKGGSTLNPTTGEEERGANVASYELPIPMVSFGFKCSY